MSDGLCAQFWCDHKDSLDQNQAEQDRVRFDIKQHVFTLLHHPSGPPAQHRKEHIPCI